MDVRSKQSIREYLQKNDVQQRILKNMQRGRNEATVTISQAAELFGITENKLRDWEEYGFLNPLRPHGPKGRRLYAPAELDKLAIIRELINAGFAASEIPADIDKVWHDLYVLHLSLTDSLFSNGAQGAESARSVEIPVDTYIEQGESLFFWKYFAMHALRLSLAVICETIPNTRAALVLPMEHDLHTIAGQTNYTTEDLSLVGEALIGWYNPGHAFQTFLTSKPSFQYTTDYRVEVLANQPGNIEEGKTGGEHPGTSNSKNGASATSDEVFPHHIYIVVQREAKTLVLNNELVEMISRLLYPLYAHKAVVKMAFQNGLHDLLAYTSDFYTLKPHEDMLLNNLANLVVSLGGKDEEQQTRWNFCSIAIADFPDPIVPLQQKSLIVCARSDEAPYTIGNTRFYTQESFSSAHINAFQSGHTFYQPHINVEESWIEQRALKDGATICSSIAIPIEGVNGLAIAVLYVASTHKQAFSQQDQRVLRMLGRMIKTLLLNYHTEALLVSGLREVVARPEIVDTTFQEFLSEDAFNTHVEDIIAEAQHKKNLQLADTDALSIIALDIDRQTSIAAKYGDEVARELSLEVGLRVYSQMRAFKDDAEYRLYHIGADRYYLLTKGVALEQVRKRADLLRQMLHGSYGVDPHHFVGVQPHSSESLITLHNITTRIGISSYLYSKLNELLLRCTSDMPITEVRTLISSFLENVLALGKQRGGDIIMSWDPSTHGFIRLD
jgi:GGDEF domain-containing protein